MKVAVRFMFSMMLVAAILLYKPVQASAAGTCVGAQGQSITCTGGSCGYGGGSCSDTTYQQEGDSENCCIGTCVATYSPNGTAIGDCMSSCMADWCGVN